MHVEDDWEHINHCGWVYVLRLRENHYYVGSTITIPKFLHELLASDPYRDDAVEWLALHRPIGVVYWERVYVPDAVHLITLDWMKVHGWTNVRGGRWSTTRIQGPPRELVTLLEDTVTEFPNGIQHFVEEEEEMQNRQNNGVGLLRKSKQWITDSFHALAKAFASPTTFDLPSIYPSLL